MIDRVVSALSELDTGLSPDDIRFDGDTGGELTSTGARTEWTTGDEDGGHTTLGFDFRYQQQNIMEAFETNIQTLPSLRATNMPTSRMFNPGMYVEAVLPMTYNWKSTVGGRLDRVFTDARVSEISNDTNLDGFEDNLKQDDTLYAFFMTNEFRLTRFLSSSFGVGHSQRPPTLIERYSDGLFLALAQNGFSRVIGTPDLSPERAWQIDLSFEYDDGCYSKWRTTLFHSWIFDYISYQGNRIVEPSSATLLRTVNIDEATIWGLESYLEIKLTNRLTLFGSARYLEGKDEVHNRPLTGISPFEGRVGWRMKDSNDTWGLEVGSRIVNQQDRLGVFLINTIGGFTPEELESITPDFFTIYIRGYYNVSQNFHVIGGIENLTDERYVEHLSLRLPAVDGRFPQTPVLGPGITPYVGFEWTY